MSDLPQWYYDLTEPQKATGTATSVKQSQVTRLARPVFFKLAAQPSTAAKKTNPHEQQLKVRRAWEVATQPAKSLPMNLIMTYISGNELQVMTISMTMYMFFISPITQIAGVQPMFEPFEGGKSIKKSILSAKAVFILCCLLNVAVGIWKVGQMGLLPTHSTDWIAWEIPAKYHF